MARKDVDLVIRAKDEAGNALDAITDAINEFLGAQDKLGRTGKNTATVLSTLGKAASDLQKQFKGMDLGSKIAEDMNKAGSAVERLKKEFEDAQGVSAKLAKELADAGEAASKFQNKVDGAAKAQERQANQLAKSKAAQKELNTAMNQAVAERDRLTAAETKLSAQIEKQSATVEKAQARYGELSAKVAAVAEPTKTLSNSLASSGSNLEKQSAKLAELRERYTATTGAIQQVAGRIDQLGNSMAEGAAKIAQQETVLGHIVSNYRELGEASKAAAANQKTFVAAAATQEAAVARLGEQLNKTEVEFGQFAAASQKLEGAMTDLSGQSSAVLTKSFDAQRRAMLETKREWLEGQQALGKLSQEISSAGVPTQKMAEEFTRLRQVTAQNKQEYIAQRDGLHALSAVLKTTATDLSGLQAKQQQFAQVTAATGTAISGIRQRASESAGSYNLLSGNANRAGVAIREVGSASRSAATASSDGARSTNAFAEAYRKLYGESRQAMSWTQRLRGEVLSLISAYGGIYGVINLLGQVVTAYQTLEAAQSRLNVAFNGDQTQVGKELDYIRRMANRLGIELGTLSTEYSKFAVATQGTALQGERTRKIFTAVAEAARVNKSSNEELQGVFTALTQIVSKGAVQMEELRQQLGDRLPGAIQLMASALGVGTQELIKMMEQGQVTAEALVPFADKMSEKFGPGLAKALTSTSAELGRFSNAAQQAMIVFANAGFIEAFNNLLRTMTETLKSADFLSFAQRASAAFGLVIDAIGFLIKNFRLVIAVATAFTAVKILPFLTALGGGFVSVMNNVGRAGKIFAITGAQIQSSTTAVGAATVAFRGLTLAVRALLSATVIGAAFTAVSVAISYWATSADKATEAFANHQAMVDRVRDAYEAAGGATDKFYKSLADISKSQAEANLLSLQQALQKIKDDTISWIDSMASLSARRSAFNIFSGTKEAQDQYNEIQKLNQAWAANTLSTDKYKAALDRIAQSGATPELKAYAVELQNSADAAGSAEKKIDEAAKVVKVFSDNAKESKDAADALGKTTDDSAAAAARAAEGTEKWKKAMDDLHGVVKDTSEQLDNLKDKAKLDAAFESAVKAAQNMGQLNQAIKDYNTALNGMYADQAGKDFGKYTSGIEASKVLLRDKESFRPTPYWDVNAYRVGYGSDTVTLADGTIQKVVQGMRITVEDAERDLSRRITEFQSTVKGQIGADTFGKFNPQQQAALTSIAYNYGSLPKTLVEAIKSGMDDKGIADAIRGLGGDNNGINRARRNTEAGLFETRGGDAAQVKELEDQRKEAEKERKRKEEADAKDRAQTAQQITDNDNAIKQQQLINDGKGREAAIEKAIADAKKQNPKITDAEIAKLREQEGVLYDLKNVKTQDKAQQKEAVALMQQINAQVAQRTALTQQLKAAEAAGNTTAVEDTKAKLDEVNKSLESNVAKAKEMWGAIGGTTGEANLTKLDTVIAKTETLKQKAQENYIDWTRVGNLFASGLTNAFDSFAQAVANGEDVGEAARTAFLQFAADFLRQIAQMIIQQAILNALRSFAPSLFGGVGVGVGHTGGLIGSKRVGSGNSSRKVDPGIFMGAMRFHNGGLPGLAPNEVPLIAKKGEEILNENDPRNALNGGLSPAGGGSTPQDIKVINTFDAASFLSEGLNSKSGQRAFLNFVSANPRAFKSALGN
ncbi:MAG: hypothetical protein DI533_20290 [Cereibacter sphaeroides]|uniref:Lysozyme n=1 Tax=Cereibacter sphaeroides TaxID=1063 RepID=A0A2W5TWN8_CERSP|nr:MAG: hypothetical protein DI533_20290 [Cereibacter sphaeroides]